MKQVEKTHNNTEEEKYHRIDGMEIEPEQMHTFRAFASVQLSNLIGQHFVLHFVNIFM